MCNQTQFIRSLHGSLFDRGSADAYYGRPQDPHWYKGDPSVGEKVTDLTEEEVAEYTAGYNHQMKKGMFK